MTPDQEAAIRSRHRRCVCDPPHCLADDEGAKWSCDTALVLEALDAAREEIPVHYPECDEPGCLRAATCGWPTRPGGTGPNGGYRRTCFDHMRARLMTP